MADLSIAVIIPVRNCARYLVETIECVGAQGYSAVEIMVVDDGSTDGSGDLARATGRCTVLESPGVGPAGARNLGIRESRSDLLMFLDADDLLGPEAFPRAVDALLQAPQAGFAQGYVQNFVVRPDGSMNLFTRPYRYINVGSGLWRRSVFDRLGLFDVSLRYAEDVDFFMRCWEQDVEKVFIDTLFLMYRRHPGNMTRGLSGAGFGTVRAFRKRIERIAGGEYDPHRPRPLAWPEYFGRGPDVMDVE